MTSILEINHKDYIIFWWMIGFVFLTIVFIFNPLYAIFCSIILLPIYIMDILNVFLKEIKK